MQSHQIIRKGAGADTGNAGHFASVRYADPGTDADLDMSFLDCDLDADFGTFEEEIDAAASNRELAAQVSEWLAENSADIGWDDRNGTSATSPMKFATAEAEQRVTTVGAALSARAVELSGIDPEAERAAHRDRHRAAIEAVARTGAEVRDLNTADDPKMVRAIEAYTQYCGRAGTYTDRLREQVGAYDPELPAKIDAAVARRTEAADKFRAIAGAVDPQSAAALSALSDGYLQALSEVRDLNGQLAWHEKSTKPGRTAFDEAQQVYPTDWVQHSNQDPTQMMALISKKRAHYQHCKLVKTKKRERSSYEVRMSEDVFHERKDGVGTSYTLIDDTPDADGNKLYRADYWQWQSRTGNPDQPPRGRGWEFHKPTGHWRQPSYRMRTVDQTITPEILTNKRTPRIEGRSETFEVAVHESAHRYEATVPHVSDLERAFLDRRCRDAAGNLRPQMSINPGEVGRDGGFVDNYVGKEYRGDPSREVLSVGTQAIFGGALGGLVGLGNYEPDTDHRDFVLGLLATAGRKS